ncbi:hypothetical protein [Xanthomonas phage XPV2]|nr:hypothetical protein [Xanthomonas phage XPV2]
MSKETLLGWQIMYGTKVSALNLSTHPDDSAVISRYVRASDGRAIYVFATREDAAKCVRRQGSTNYTIAPVYEIDDND